MPWWSWVLIWVGLGVVLLASFAGFIWWYWTIVREIVSEVLPIFPLLERLTAQLSGLADHEPVPDTTMDAEELSQRRKVWQSRLTRQRVRLARTPKRRNLAHRERHARRHAVADPGPRRSPLQHL